MQFFIIILAICFIIFLFSLYAFSHDDFILLRRNVSTDQVFDYAFALCLTSLLFSRVFYVLLNPRPVFLNPLGFILFPYFPGLSFVGGILGSLFFVLILIRKNNFPLGRVFDFFTLSFLSAMPIGFIGYMLLSRNFSVLTISEMVAYLIFFAFSLLILMKKFIKSSRQDGLIANLFLILFSVIALVHNVFLHVKVLRFDNILILIILISSIASLFKILLHGRTFIKKWI